jgi:ketosteroid isomerase-like protein
MPSDISLEQIAPELAAAFNAKDAAKLASLYTESATLMPPYEKMVKGRAAIEAWYRPALERIGHLQIVPMQTGSLGENGFQVGTFFVRREVESGLLSYKYVLILKRVGAKWLIDCDIWNADELVKDLPARFGHHPLSPVGKGTP